MRPPLSRWRRAAPPEISAAVRVGVPTLVVLASIFGALVGCESPASRRPPPRAVIFVVLDNVRADRLSLCGYSRPTTPYLESLRDVGAEVSCSAKAPSTWTYPSHASFFTGTELTEHGAGLATSDGGVEFAWGTRVKPLGPELPTLAERMAARGYQTVMISGNPVLSADAGLARGFDVVRVAEDFEDLYGPHLVRELDLALEEEVEHGERPLFLFVNICDAHQPWWKIPASIDWLPERPRLSFRIDPDRGNDTRRRYIRSRMKPARARAMLDHLDDVYDYAVRRADNTLARVVETVREAGWLDEGYRLVITSDHGELLGEHQLLGHEGPYMYEGLTNVPLVVAGSEPPPALPSPISAIEAYDLALDGELGGHAVRSAAYRSPSWEAWFGPEIGGHPGAAIWDPPHKRVWQRDRFLTYDLATDSTELDPHPLAGGTERAVLDELAATIERSAEDASPFGPELTKTLQAVGYLD